MLNLKKIATITAIALASVFAVTGCSTVGDGVNPESVFGGKWKVDYLKVNEQSVACYSREDSNSTSATCQWHDVELPNAVEITELSDQQPKSKNGWNLHYLVSVDNKTVPCISNGGILGSCDFGSTDVDGSYGESTPSPSPTAETPQL